MKYVPDRWVVVEYGSTAAPQRRVLGSWYGGYTDSDGWRISSGITDTKEFEDRWEFTNESGSVYVCPKGAHGMSSYTSSLYNSWVDELAPTETLTILEGYDNDPGT